MKTRRMILSLLLFLSMLNLAGAETLKYGMKGDSIVKVQRVLIDQGYLQGTADGVFGRKTEAAVRRFQKKNGLRADGLVGEKTQSVLFPDHTSVSLSSTPSSQKATPAKTGYFHDDYSTINSSTDPDRIRLLQKALISMNYLRSSADGSYGTMTKSAVRSFQQGNGLKGDGVAGIKTLKAIEKALASGHRAINTIDSAEPLPAGTGKMDAPDKSEIQLLHWYNDIKPNLKYKAILTIYEPVSGLGWILMVHSKGRHCEGEPLTLKDTQILYKAFNNKQTWSQKGVYVLLPDGRWTVGATASVPQLTGYIKDNGFDGHLSIHFFRDMEECEKKDPFYGVSNQKTIRALWKKVSGETVN